MKFKTHNDCKISPSGTSLTGEIIISFAKLVDIFGEPFTGQGRGCKVDAEWTIQFKNGIIATIYNYKDGINYNGCEGIPIEDIINWHIGGVNHDSFICVAETLGIYEKEKDCFIPTVTKSRFLDWMFSERDDYLGLAISVIKQLKEKNNATVTTRSIFDTCGYIPEFIATNDEGQGREFEPSECRLID